MVKVFVPLGYDCMSLGNCFPTFRDNVVFLSSEVEISTTLDI